MVFFRQLNYLMELLGADSVEINKTPSKEFRRAYIERELKST